MANEPVVVIAAIAPGQHFGRATQKRQYFFGQRLLDADAVDEHGIALFSDQAIEHCLNGASGGWKQRRARIDLELDLGSQACDRRKFALVMQIHCDVIVPIARNNLRQRN